MSGHSRSKTFKSVGLHFLAAASVFAELSTACAREIPQPPIAPNELAETIGQQFKSPRIPEGQISALIDAAFDKLALKPDFTGSEVEQRQKAGLILLRLPGAAQLYLQSQVEPALREGLVINNVVKVKPADPDFPSGCKSDQADAEHYIYEYPQETFDDTPAAAADGNELIFGKSQSYKLACRIFSDKSTHSLTVFVETAAELVALPMVTKDMQIGYLNLDLVASIANDAVADDVAGRPDMPIEQRLAKFHVRAVPDLNAR